MAASHAFHADMWGERAGKYRRLLDGGVALSVWADIQPRPPFFLLKPFAGDDAAEYDEWTSVKRIFPVKSVGIVTARDALTVRWSKREIWRVVREVAEGDYTGASRGFLCYPRADVMGHMLGGGNVGLMACRQTISSGWQHAFATSVITDDSMVSNKTRERGYLFPLYLHPGVGKSGVLPFSPWPRGRGGRRPNLDPGFVERMARATGLRFIPDGRGDLRATFGPEDLLAYIYAVFHSPGYRERYEAHLKLDFPRVPLPGTPKLGRELMKAGHDLLALHLLESPALDHPLTDYAGPRAPTVGRVGWSNGTVWLDAARTNARERHRATGPGRYGFHGVREEVWDFQVGGYQVCHKWLKDRKGRVLSDADIAHYQKIVVALSETITIMDAIDGVIGHFGGWPTAFDDEAGPTRKPPGLALAAESGPPYDAGRATRESDR